MPKWVIGTGKLKDANHVQRYVLIEHALTGINKGNADCKDRINADMQTARGLWQKGDLNRAAILVREPPLQQLYMRRCLCHRCANQPDKLGDMWADRKSVV